VSSQELSSNRGSNDRNNGFEEFLSQLQNFLLEIIRKSTTTSIHSHHQMHVTSQPQFFASLHLTPQKATNADTTQEHAKHQAKKIFNQNFSPKNAAGHLLALHIQNTLAVLMRLFGSEFHCRVDVLRQRGNEEMGRKCSCGNRK
jgi:hypothetical protein